MAQKRLCIIIQLKSNWCENKEYPQLSKVMDQGKVHKTEWF